MIREILKQKERARITIKLLIITKMMKKKKLKRLLNIKAM